MSETERHSEPTSERTPTVGAAGKDSPRARYLPYVDGLRAIAVIAVILYHLRGSWLPGGFAGVDVFFVISGFVVCASVSHWHHGGLRELLAYFYARRMQRIAPALLVCLLATSLASAMLIPAAWLSSSNDLTGLFAFVGMSNLFLAFNDENYFSPSTDFNPYTHTWSLGVEEQFYLVFPLLFFAWTRGGRWRGVSLGLIAILLLASLGDAWQRAQVDAGAAFYLMTTRFWQLASGVLLYLILARREAPSPTASGKAFVALGAYAALTLLAGALWISAPSAFPFPGAWMPVLATLGLLGFIHRSDSGSALGRSLSSSPLVGLGRRSYSLYLWHWPVLVLMRWTCGLDTALAIGTALLLTFALAELSYRFVEKPLRYSPLLRRWPRVRVVWTGLAVIAVCAVLSAALVKGKTVVSLSTVMRHSEEWYPEPLKSLDDVPGCNLRKTKRWNGLANARTYTRADCAPAAMSSPSIFAVGDSHALAYVTMLSEYVLRNGAEATLYPNAGCSFANLRSARESEACMAQEQAILDDVAAHAKRGDVLFLASLRLNRFSDQDGTAVPYDVFDAFKSDAAEQVRRRAEAELEKQLLPLANAGIRIVFEAPKPLLAAPPFRCSDVFNAGNPICRPGLHAPRSALLNYRAPVMASLQRLSGHLGASIWDPLPVLCPQKRCSASEHAHPLFFDGDHISAYANRKLYPSFAGFVRAEAAPSAP